MIYYIDTSFLLSILFNETTKANSIGIWKKAPIRMSSVLLKAESLISLRRLNSHLNLKQNWLQIKQTELDEILNEVTMRNVDEKILEVIKLNNKLADCRTLDAVHLVTAVEIRDNTLEEKIVICTYDKKMSELARKMRFQVIPNTNITKKTEKFPSL